MRDQLSVTHKTLRGFTLLEVMMAMAIIAIALPAILGAQSQGVWLANEAEFHTTAPLLAQFRMAEIETMELDNLTSESGDFGERFPGYAWRLVVDDYSYNVSEEVSGYLKNIVLTVSWGDHGDYRYVLTLYRFNPETG